MKITVCAPFKPSQLALASLIAGILLVNDVNTTLAANNAAVGITLLKRFERIGDLHDNS